MRTKATLLSKALVIILVPFVFELIFVHLLINLSERADLLARRLQDSQEMVGGVDRALRLSAKLLLESTNILGKQKAVGRGRIKTGYDDLRKVDIVLQSLTAFSKRYQSESLSRFLDDCRVTRDLVAERFNLCIPSASGLMPADPKTRLKGIDRLFAQLADVREQQKQVLRQARLAEVFIAEEKTKSARAARQERQLRKSGQILLLCGVFGNVLIAWLLNVNFNRSILRRLLILMENSRFLVMKQTLKPPEPAGDEIGRLDEALHRLAAELESARSDESAAVNNAVGLVCSLDEKLCFLELSPSLKDVLGYEVEDLLEKECTILCSDELSRTELLDSFSNSKEEQAGSRCEIELITASGEGRFFLWSSLWSSEEKRFFCVAYDISDRIAAEQQLRASELRVRSLIDKMPAGLIVFDQDGLIEEANEYMANLLHCPAGALSGRHMTEILTAKSVMRAQDLLGQKEEQECLIPDLEMIAGDQSTFPAEAFVSKQAIGGNMKQIAIVEDLRESKELERIKREFLATLTHDIRTPLSSVRASLTLLSAGALGCLSEESKDKVAASEKAATELIDLINDVLEIARLRAEKLANDAELCDLRELFSEIIDNLSELAGDRTLEISSNIGAVRCSGDSEKLRKAFEVLLRRSYQRAALSSRLGLSVEACEDFVQIEISYHGECYSDSEVFQILHGGIGETNVGSSLDLSLSRAIIIAHGGHLSIPVNDSDNCKLRILLPSGQGVGRETGDV